LAKDEIDSGVYIAIPDLRKLRNAGTPSAWIAADEVIGSAGERSEPRANGVRVGAGEADLDAADTKAAAMQERDVFGSAAADEKHVAGGLAGVAFEYQG
jgi:hypothetical protein